MPTPLPPFPAPHPLPPAAEVLSFWLGDGVTQGWPTQDLGKRWFGGGADLDSEIRTRFGSFVEQALAGGLTDWEADVHNRLALIILLDQFPRNVFRSTARAFAGDARVQQLVLQTRDAGEDQRLAWVARVFTYMPLMHAESLGLQELGVAAFTALVSDAPASLKERLMGNLSFAQQHRDIIARFGRFPYRNAALGRPNTPEEEDFLLKGPRFGQ